jgi:hypothetical protein
MASPQKITWEKPCGRFWGKLRTLWRRSFPKCSRSGGSRWDSRSQESFHSRKESSHWIAHYIPIVNAQGTVSRVGLVVLEVTAPRVLEESVQKLDKQLRQETNRLQMLTDVTSLLSSNWDVAQVFPRVSARLRRVLFQEFATFALHDTGTGLLVYQATDFPLSKGLIAGAILFVEGQTPRGVYIVCSGKVSLSTTSREGKKT